jgi:hypothetical protein
MKRLLTMLLLIAVAYPFGNQAIAAGLCVSKVVPGPDGLFCVIDPLDGGELIEIPLSSEDDVAECLRFCSLQMIGGCINGGVSIGPRVRPDGTVVEDYKLYTCGATPGYTGVYVDLPRPIQPSDRD